MKNTIAFSVGEGGKNRPQDVGIVQTLLNSAGEFRGVPEGRLEVDGIVGPLTLAAIRAFQKYYCKIVDGRVDPNQETIKKLNQMAAPLPRLNDGVSYLLPKGGPTRLV